MTTANTTITRKIKERRTITRDIEPRTLKGVERSSDFYATGITVERLIDPSAANERLRDYLRYRIDGYHVKRDGTRSNGRGATDILGVAPMWEDLGLKFYIDGQHFDEIRQLCEEALEAFNEIEWEKVPA